MTPCLLDTNVVIGLLKGYPPCVEQVMHANCALSDMAVSQITRMELLGFPNITGEEVQTIAHFLAAIQVIAIDLPIEDQTIALRRSSKLKLPDAIIAATAMVRGLQLLTLDKTVIQVLGQMPA
jgi:predicted nucleic acid-binding protein